jgi:hypothetical protein
LRGKCQFAHTGVGSVGLRGHGPPGGCNILLPTEISRFESQLFGQMFGRSALNDRVGSFGCHLPVFSKFSFPLYHSFASQRLNIQMR